jgi:hypothetical protein
VKKFVRFFSLTTATQVCLLINQLGLLPLQLRLWGVDTTSQWIVAVAIANLMTVTDLGLRNAGHVELSASVRFGDRSAAQAFAKIWALTRTLMVVLTALFLLYHWVAGTVSAVLVILTITLAFDTLLQTRNTWLDTLGLFNRVESLFLIMAAARIGFSIVALAAFHVSPQTLALIWLATILPVLPIQSRMEPSLGLLKGGFRHLQWQQLKLVYLVVADPLTNWTRISLPIVVVSAIAPPSFVAAFVGLRAVFGLARQVIIQLSRYASVVSIQHATHRERIIIPAVFASISVGVAIASVTLADHGRLLEVWLGHGHGAYNESISLSFAAGIITFGHLVTTFLMMRLGAVREVAMRQYVFLVTCFITAALGRFFGSVEFYLVLLGLQEVLVAGLFITFCGTRIMRAYLTGFGIAFLTVGLLSVAVYADLGGVFMVLTPGALAASFGFAALTTIATVSVLLLAYFGAEGRRNEREA